MQRLSHYFVTVFTLLVMCTIAQAAEQKASGTYVYDSTAKTLEFTFLSSSFVCDGPPAGEVMSVTDVAVSGSILNWTELWEGLPDIMTWTRVTGSGDSLIGKWQRSSNGGTSTTTFEFLDATHFEAIGGTDSSECPEGTGTHTASGTYTYDSESNFSNLIYEVTTSNFTCSGPAVGTDIFTVSALTATSMTWTWNDGSQMLLTRETGVPDSILGMWESEDSGNTYTMTIEATTISIVAQIFNCNDDGDQDGAYISTNHELDSYWIDFKIVDSQGTITGVTVVGPGISDPVNLTPVDNQTTWVSWFNPDPALKFIGIPTLPRTYTLTITRDDQSTVEKILTVNSFLLEFAHPDVPAENESLKTLQTFAWTGLGADYNYSVQLLTDKTWQLVWEQYDIYGDSVVYSGPVLAPGSYYYSLQANGSDGNSSRVSVPFTILLKGDLDGDGDIDLEDVITGLKVVTGKTSERISTGGDVNGDKKIGVEEAIYSMRVTGELLD